MKTSKIIFNILLFIAVVVMAYFCVVSILTPIKFDETRTARETAVIKNLKSLRDAEIEYQRHYGRFTDNADSLLIFLRTVPKKEVLKEGSLTDNQLEAGLTETKAVKIMDAAKAKAQKKQSFANDDELYAYVWENDADVRKNGLQGFRRDTIAKNMIETIYKGEYNETTIGNIIYIPYSNGQQYEFEVNDNYTTSQGIHVPLFEVRAPFSKYLGDLNKQELINLIDKEEQLDKYAGLKVGSVDAPNNNAGNWE